MAKMSKKTLAELDRAIEQLGGGVAPIQPPKRSRQSRKVKVRKPGVRSKA
jgi:hypothetical protein